MLAKTELVVQMVNLTWLCFGKLIDLFLDVIFCYLISCFCWCGNCPFRKCTQILHIHRCRLRFQFHIFIQRLYLVCSFRCQVLVTYDSSLVVHFPQRHSCSISLSWICCCTNRISWNRSCPRRFALCFLHQLSQPIAGVAKTDFRWFLGCCRRQFIHENQRSSQFYYLNWSSGHLAQLHLWRTFEISFVFV